MTFKQEEFKTLIEWGSKQVIVPKHPKNAGQGEKEGENQEKEIPLKQRSKKEKSEGLLLSFLSNEPEQMREWIAAGASLKNTKIGKASLLMTMLRSNQPVWREIILEQPLDLWAGVSWIEILIACQKWAWEQFKPLDDALNITPRVWMSESVLRDGHIPARSAETWLFGVWSNAAFIKEAFEEKITPLLSGSTSLSSHMTKYLSTNAWNIVSRLKDDQVCALEKQLERQKSSLKVRYSVTYDSLNLVNWALPVFQRCFKESATQAKELNIYYRGNHTEVFKEVAQQWNVLQQGPGVVALELSDKWKNVSDLDALITTWILQEDKYFDTQLSEWRGLKISEGVRERVRLAQWIDMNQGEFNVIYLDHWKPWLGEKLPKQVKIPWTEISKPNQLNALFGLKGTYIDDVTMLLKKEPRYSWDRLTQVEIKALLKKEELLREITVDKRGVDFIDALKKHQPKLIAEFQKKLLNKNLEKRSDSKPVKRRL